MCKYSSPRVYITSQTNASKSSMILSILKIYLELSNVIRERNYACGWHFAVFCPYSSKFIPWKRGSFSCSKGCEATLKSKGKLIMQNTRNSWYNHKQSLVYILRGFFYFSVAMMITDDDEVIASLVECCFWFRFWLYSSKMSKFLTFINVLYEKIWICKLTSDW